MRRVVGSSCVLSRNSGASDRGVLSVAEGSRCTTLKEVAHKTLFATPSGRCQLSATKLFTRRIKEQEVGNSSATQLFGRQMKVYGELMERGEVVFHSNVGDEGDELAGSTVLRRPSRTRRRQGGGKPARPHRAGLS